MGCIPSKIYNECKKLINDEIFSCVGLYEIVNGTPVVKFPYSKNTKELALKKLDFLQSMKLEPGEYALAACINNNNRGNGKNWPFTVTEPKTIQITSGTGSKKKAGKTEPLTVDAEPMPERIDWEEYKDLLKENAMLKSSCELKDIQYKMLEDRFKDYREMRQMAMNDAAPQGSDDKWLNRLEKLSGPLEALMDGFFSSRNNAQPPQPQKTVKRPKARQEQPVYNGYTYDELLDELEPQTDEELTDSLEQINETDPALAARCAKELNFNWQPGMHDGHEEEEEEEEEEEQGNGTED